MDKSAALIKNRDEPVKFDRKAFAEEFTKLISTPGYSTEDDKSRMTIEGEKKAMKKEKVLTDSEQMLEDLAAGLTSALAGTAETFMLNAPMTLTVKKPGEKFSNVAHVGSEDFSFVRAYRGQRGKLIFVFKPVMVSDYEEMECAERIAMESLTGFKELVNERFGKINEMMAEVRELESSKKEQEKLLDRHEKYKSLGFGSW